MTLLVKGAITFIAEDDTIILRRIPSVANSAKNLLCVTGITTTSR
jgi:hypothetical protein